MSVAVANLSVVDLANCHLLSNTDQPFILTLKMGEDLFEGVLQCAYKMQLKSAMLSGLGALSNVTVAFYNLSTKQYHTKLFTGMYELISLNGNLSLLENKHFVHIHAALGTETYSVKGGHIMSATVGASAEIAITPLSNNIQRVHDPVTGLKLMCPVF